MSVFIKDCFGETPKPTRETPALAGIKKFRDRAMNFRVEHPASSIKNPVNP